MNLLVIKIGKALSAIRNDGVIRAGKRILAGMWAIVRPVGCGSVLFISGGTGDSARYRTKHVAEFLRNHGIEARITVQDRPGLVRYLNHFQVFVFHRVMMTPSVSKMIEAIQKQKKTIIFETDDLVFDQEYLQHMDILKNMNVFEKKQYEKGVGVEILENDFVRVATATTSFLAEKLRERGKEVFIVPNMLSEEDLAWAQQSRERKALQEKKDEEICIGYSSGTKSHDKDFMTATPALIRILQEYEQVRLRIVGPLLLDDAFAPFSQRIERVPFLSRKKHFFALADITINIAPLEMGNPFCEGKSELKWFEAGIVGVPTVASATQTFCEAIESGKDGFLAKTQKEWYDILSKLIEDSSVRHSVGKEAQKSALSRYTTESEIGKEYIQFLKTRKNKK